MMQVVADDGTALCFAAGGVIRLLKVMGMIDEHQIHTVIARLRANK
jgi:hypothetical protein